MGKVLVIAEKPSVAGDISRALGKFTKEKDYYENDEYVISSAVGHLLELGLPSEMGKVKWGFASLPIIPEKFELKPIARSEDRYKVLKKLIKRKDITSFINACDAGREGELIFRYIIKAVGIDKPIKRLWLQSMTPASIRENFGKLRPGSELEPLAEAATCRSESDWLVGINGTRALTAFNSKGGGFQLTTVGRVQTPTLAVLVEREDKIRKFVSKKYWELHGTFDVKAGAYPGRWFDESFKKSDAPEGDARNDFKAERLWDKEKAEAIAAACTGKPGAVTEEKKPSTQLSPLLYDLTTLQREANGRFGFSAKRTLQLAQFLYERHKVLTYPRTDSRYLPEDYVGTVHTTLEQLKETDYGPFAGKILANQWVKPTKRVFNQAKVSDHFAIIPTTEPATKLDEQEQKIYDMVVRRFLSIFYPAAVYEVTTRITRVDIHPFKSEGKILKEAGWLEVYGKAGVSDGEDNDALLVPVIEGEKVTTTDVEVRELDTRPPARFSEATLLSAMEGAGKMVEDEELRDAMAEKGLGTPATRAAIIEGLILESYIYREGRELIPTPKAFHLLDTLKMLQINGLTSPEMTGEWEYKLKQIEQSKLSREVFMREIEQFTRDIVERTKGFDEEKVGTKPFDAIDPFSGEGMIETLRDFRSPDGTLQIRKAIAGRMIDPEEVKILLKDRFIGPLDGFKSRLGRPFSAALKLTDEKKLEFAFDPTPGEGGMADFSEQEPLGICPKDGGRIFETPAAFICEHAVGEEKKCDFRIGKKILSREITKDQVVKLLTTGKTDLLEKFVSQRTKRPFSAFLILKDGKVGFEFPPREAKAKGAKGGARGKKKPAEKAEAEAEAKTEES
jgi:DNA topoisomerase-3